MCGNRAREGAGDSLLFAARADSLLCTSRLWQKVNCPRHFALHRSAPSPNISAGRAARCFMAEFTVNPHRHDPYKKFKFRVKWDGRYVAGVSKLSALNRTTEVIRHREGGDPDAGAAERGLGARYCGAGAGRAWVLGGVGGVSAYRCRFAGGDRARRLPRFAPVAPPSVLPDISPAGGEIGCHFGFRQSPEG